MSDAPKAQSARRMNRRTRWCWVLLCVLGLAAAAFAPRARAQGNVSAVEVGLDYNYVRANGPPGGCGCFSMNGGNAWIGLPLSHNFSAVAEFSGEYADNVNATGADLTIYSYLFGPRYTLGNSSRFRPFGQVLLGGAHVTGTFQPNASGASGSFNAFAMVAGGGLDLGVTRHLALRAIEADYYLTRFPNGVNGRQNNLRISAGFIVRF
jgi:outer membrane immunogenic protein